MNRRESFSRRLRAGVIAIAQAEMRKIRRSPGVFLGRALNALLWLLVFGTVLAKAGLPSMAGLDYRAYLTPAILAQGGVIFAIPVGLSVVWERDMGQLPRMLATPLPRTALVLGKAVGACAMVLVQSLVVLVVLIALDIPVHPSFPGSIGMLAMLMLGTAAFAGMAITLGAIYRDRDRYVAMTQILMIPLIFVSCALYPLSLMPSWLRLVAELNPLTYEIEAMRQMFLGAGGGSLWLDFAIVTAFLLAMLVAAVRTYPQAIR